MEVSLQTLALLVHRSKFVSESALVLFPFVNSQTGPDLTQGYLQACSYLIYRKVSQRGRELFEALRN
jgi:hypothetical protein